MTEPREPLAPRIATDRAAVPIAPADLADGLEDVCAKDVALAGAHVGRLGMLDCAFERGDLSGLDAEGSSLVRVALIGSRLTGLRAGGILLRDVLLRDCRMDLATLAGARLERVTFERCDLRELDLQDARLHDVRFLGSDLSGAILHGADVSRTELRDCSYADLRGIEGLRGATLAPADAMELAPALAAALGIRVG